MKNESPPLRDNWRDFFPLPEIRPKQEKAMDFIYRMVAAGIKDIILSAPTGSGKSVLGATSSFWASQEGFPGTGVRGGYYLCTQKLLQDQLENDIARYPVYLQSATSIKAAAEYDCPFHGDCGVGHKRKPVCQLCLVSLNQVNDAQTLAAWKEQRRACAYKLQFMSFMKSDLAITNYPYFFAHYLHTGLLPRRKLLVMDESHTLENQLLRLVDLSIGKSDLDKFLPVIKAMPEMDTALEFADWIESAYLPGLESRLEAYDTQDLTRQQVQELDELQAHISKIKLFLDGLETDPDNWIYWQEEDKKTTLFTSIAKPLSVASYFKEMIRPMSDVRLYMSAYPGSKEVFCRTLGLNPDTTAMLSLGSVFPKEQRPIHAALVGSMSKTNQEATMPVFLRVLSEIFNAHESAKGIVHCHSYALGTAIYKALQGTPHAARLLFPTHADKRENVYRQHRDSKEPTVILSPSFTEGFDFADDSARWQVLAKVPYPYLGDKQVAAKRDADPEWYAMRTVMTIIQASGRICRSETDHGITYITDADFANLYRRYGYLFPAWWKEALQWH
jgi:Rad3-related DNA helicase